MSKYRETLYAWASQFIPEGARVEKVDITYDDGYEPTFTDRPASLWVGVYYRTSEGERGWTEDISMETFSSTVGEMLTALFAIEETNQ